MFKFSRRDLLKAGVGFGGLLASGLPTRLLAQPGDPVRMGLVIPLTGATSQFGATMSAAAKIAVEEINKAGGIGGHPIEVLIEDDQSNPEAAVRAARKLIDVDKVVSIGGSYASSVTSAIAPLCWEGRTTLFTASGADSITQLPHQGFIFRTSPTVTLQGTRVGRFAVDVLGAKSMFFLGPQTPFAQTYIDLISGLFKQAGGTGGGLIYEDKRASYRTEVDQALRTKPDVIVLGGYVPDTAVVLKDLYRAGYQGQRIGFSFGVNKALTEAVPAEVSEGTYSLVPSASESSETYKRLVGKLGLPSLDSYSCQVYDHVMLTALALSRGKSPLNGTTVRDNVRNISQAPGGRKVSEVAEALALAAGGTPMDYDGASGPLEFLSNGDVADVFFRYEQVRGGKLALLKVA